GRRNNRYDFAGDRDDGIGRSYEFPDEGIGNPNSSTENHSADWIRHRAILIDGKDSVLARHLRTRSTFCDVHSRLGERYFRIYRREDIRQTQITSESFP